MSWLSEMFGGGSDSNDEQIKYQKKQEEIARKKEEDRVAKLNAALDKIKAAFHGSKAVAAVPHKYDWSKFDANDYDTGDAVTGLPAGWTFVRTEGKKSGGGGGSTAAVKPATATPAVVAKPGTAAPAAVVAKNPYAKGSNAAKNWDAAHPAAKVSTPSKPLQSAKNPYAYGSAAAAKWEIANGNKKAVVPVGGGQSTNNPRGYADGREGGTSDFIMTNTDPGGGSHGSTNKGGGNKNGGGGGGGGGGNGEPLWQIRGPDGKLYNIGDDVVYSTDPAVAASKGFDDDFYNKYKNSMLGFYQPEVTRQYGDAQKELTYRLARAGTLKSQAANDTGADLIRQKVENDALVSDKADTAVAGLKTNIAGMENSAKSLVNAAQDPDAEAITQLSQLAGAKVGLAQPDLSPLGEVFKVATIGGANALSGYTSGRTSADIAALAKKLNTKGYGASTITR
jgi:hypothetical protein